MQKSTNEQVAWWLSDAVRPVLRPTGCVSQTVTPASGGNAGGNSQIPERTHTRGGFGLSATELYGTPLNAAELALSYPHEFGEMA
ncbi:hypothetical protein [Limnohabitans sp.]|uniref:hypothetical protein n=1 Tax=Limnohabitans sp. TaxID=1907725 RepID=UPI00286EFFA5|nr:hypothetical protein [Limnohabitans sp.]